MTLNENAAALFEEAASRAELLGIALHNVEGGGQLLDFGVETEGGIQAGIALSRLILSDLADVRITSGARAGRHCPLVEVHSDHPVLACMASQYAGCAISVNGYTAMGSGPFRAISAKESLFEDIGYRETAGIAVAALEARELPGREVFERLSDDVGLSSEALRVAVAPTGSIAGAMQVVSRSVETALHKLHSLEFDLDRVRHGFGSAPLPPVGRNDLEALGRTNDAVLYGAHVTLWITGDDDSIADMGKRVISASSDDYGRPFEKIFEAYGGNFYDIDESLFSPAEIEFRNLETGRSMIFGRINDDVLGQSFFS